MKQLVRCLMFNKRLGNSIMGKTEIRGSICMFLSVFVLALFMISSLGCESPQQVNFIDDMKEHLAVYMDEKVELDPSFSRVDTEGGTIDIDIYRSEKIERLVFSSIHIEETGAYDESVFIYPREGYDFPVLWANLSRFPSFGFNLLIVDFIPLQDIVINPNYGTEYLESLKETKTKVLDELLKGAVLDKAVDVRSLAVYALSPYKTTIMLASHGLGNLSDALKEYCETYILNVELSEMLEDQTDKEYAATKLDSFLTLLKENDPGYEYMINAFGQEITDGVFDIIF